MKLRSSFMIHGSLNYTSSLSRILLANGTMRRYLRDWRGTFWLLQLFPEWKIPWKGIGIIDINNNNK